MLLENIHSTGINHGDSGKIGFLPNGLWQYVESQWHQFMVMSSLTHLTCFEGQATKVIHLCWWVCHGRFHDILPKECSRSSMGTISRGLY